MWLDAASVPALAASSDHDFELAARAATMTREHMLLPDQRPLIACPVCDVTLRRTIVDGTDVVVDGDEHGTWFDQDEVTRFVESHIEGRAGKVTPDDLVAAGIGGGLWKSVGRLFGAKVQ